MTSRKYYCRHCLAFTNTVNEPCEIEEEGYHFQGMISYCDRCRNPLWTSTASLYNLNKLQEEMFTH